MYNNSFLVPLGTSSRYYDHESRPPFTTKQKEIAPKELPTTSCKNAETLPQKNDLSCFKSLLVTGL